MASGLDGEAHRRRHPVLTPPDSSRRKSPRPGWDGGLDTFTRRVRGTELSQKRRQLIEPVFANTRFNRRMDRFYRRGRSAVQTEWRLIATTHNPPKPHRASRPQRPGSYPPDHHRSQLYAWIIGVLGSLAPLRASGTGLDATYRRPHVGEEGTKVAVRCSSLLKTLIHPGGSLSRG
ncbi:transposase [Paraconexibacter antarcticus]|uniref:transposase n=1 Tax=Paraconexibacter antarcticus TaxID=2949664 RepID=UPI0034601E3E